MQFSRLTSSRNSQEFASISSTELSERFKVMTELFLLPTFLMYGLLSRLIFKIVTLSRLTSLMLSSRKSKSSIIVTLPIFSIISESSSALSRVPVMAILVLFSYFALISSSFIAMTDFPSAITHSEDGVSFLKPISDSNLASSVLPVESVTQIAGRIQRVL